MAIIMCYLDRIEPILMYALAFQFFLELVCQSFMPAMGPDRAYAADKSPFPSIFSTRFCCVLFAKYIISVQNMRPHIRNAMEFRADVRVSVFQANGAMGTIQRPDNATGEAARRTTNTAKMQ